MELFNIQSGCEADPCQPLIAYLQAQRTGKNLPPFIPQWRPMALHKLCQLAKFWSEAGFREEAGKLAYWLMQLKDFPSLFCPEKEYKEENFFSALSQIELIPNDPDKRLTLYRGTSLSAAFTLTGHATSLGAIYSKGAEIRSLGPQALPLSQLDRFGIKGEAIEGWIRTFALPEVWLRFNALCKEEECKIDLQFVGLEPHDPLAFVFYVKAESCQIGNEILRPKSLRRFLGEETQVKFGSLTLESSLRHKVQVIPLAGAGCFWNADFLIAFEIHPFDPHPTFWIR